MLHLVVHKVTTDPQRVMFAYIHLLLLLPRDLFPLLPVNLDPPDDACRRIPNMELISTPFHTKFLSLWYK
jgi:hypothetical protein